MSTSGTHGSVSNPDFINLTGGEQTLDVVFGTVVYDPSLPVQPAASTGGTGGGFIVPVAPANPSGDASPAAPPPVMLLAPSSSTWRPTGSRTPASRSSLPTPRPPIPMMPAMESICAINCRFHVICVSPGQDVGAKLMNFAQQSGWGIVVLSGYGLISTAILGTHGLNTIYEGEYEMINISGSIMLAEEHEIHGIQTRASTFTITMGGPDGRALVGCLAGPLVAASHVQVVVGSYQRVSEAWNHVENESVGGAESSDQDSIGA